MVQNDGQITLEIFCPSQKGHDPWAFDHPNSIVSLDEQIIIKAKLLHVVFTRWRCGQNTLESHTPKLIIGGHCIGAYMALQIVERRLNPVHVTSLHLLFPSLHHFGHISKSGKLVWVLEANQRPFLSSWTPTLAVLITIVVLTILRLAQAFPFSIIRFIVSVILPSASRQTVHITSTFLLHSSCVKQAIHLAHDEMLLNSPKKHGQELRASDGGRSVSEKTKLRIYWTSENENEHNKGSATHQIVENALGLECFGYSVEGFNKGTSMATKAMYSQQARKRSFGRCGVRKVRRRGKSISLVVMARANFVCVMV